MPPHSIESVWNFTSPRLEKKVSCPTQEIATYTIYNTSQTLECYKCVVGDSAGGPFC